MTTTLVLAAILLLLAIAITLFLAQSTTRPPSPDVTKAESQESPVPSCLASKFIVFDLETTGLSPTLDEIIEIGAIRITPALSSHPALQTLVRPLKPIPTHITQLTGISQAMVDSEGIPLREALASFIDFIGDLPLVSYNAKFDMAFLEQSARRCNIVIKNPAICALLMARMAWPGRESYRLADMAKDGGLSSDDSHRALGDCKRAAIVYGAAAAKLRKTGGGAPVPR
jgi:DNA polymerase-3 subunit epsilon